MLLQIRRLREALVALITLEGLVARVNAHVRGEIESQGEALATVAKGTGEGPLTTVYQCVSFQLGMFGEDLVADVA